MEHRGPRVPCHAQARVRKDQPRGMPGLRFKMRCGAAIGNGMSKDELIIQLVKIALGVLIAGYFLWWSLEVLNRLPPAY